MSQNNHKNTAPAAPAPVSAHSTAPATTAPTNVSPDLAMAAAVKGEAPAAKPAEKGTYPDKAYVRSKVGRMVHLHTNEVIDGKEVKISLDAFAIAQIESGKWEIIN